MMSAKQGDNFLTWNTLLFLSQTSGLHDQRQQRGTGTYAEMIRNLKRPNTQPSENAKEEAHNAKEGSSQLRRVVKKKHTKKS